MGKLKIKVATRVHIKSREKCEEESSKTTQLADDDDDEREFLTQEVEL